MVNNLEVLTLLQIVINHCYMQNKPKGKMLHQLNSGSGVRILT